MKDLYLKALELINLVPSIKHADLDKGQLDDYETRPALIFPCVLIAIELTKADDIGGNKQKVNARVTLRVAFDYVGRTSSGTPLPVQEQSLSISIQWMICMRHFKDITAMGLQGLAEWV